MSQQLKATIGSTRAYQVDDIVDITGDNGSRVNGKVKLTRTNRSVIVTSSLQADITLNCNRCLNKCRCSVAFDIEEEYFPTINVLSGLPIAIPDEPGCFLVDEHHIIDLTEAIRQYALMAIPMKVLCRPECAGLCPLCGHNLNFGPCGCYYKNTDPRWDKLKILAAVERNPQNKVKGAGVNYGTTTKKKNR